MTDRAAGRSHLQIAVDRAVVGFAHWPIAVDKAAVGPAHWRAAADHIQLANIADSAVARTHFAVAADAAVGRNRLLDRANSAVGRSHWQAADKGLGHIHSPVVADLDFGSWHSDFAALVADSCLLVRDLDIGLADLDNYHNTADLIADWNFPANFDCYSD